MGFFSGYGGRGHAMAALAGLGRLTKGKTGPLSRDARRVVSAFMRGEETEGACRRGVGVGDPCGIVSTGDKLIVNDPMSRPHVLAQRPSADAENMEVCIPATGEFEEVPEGSRKKRHEKEGSNDIRVAASALLKAVGAGVGVRTDEDGTRYFTGSKGKSRVAVPGACVRVKFSKRQRLIAAEAVEAMNEWKKKNTDASRRFPTAAQYAKSRAAIRKAMMEVRRLQAAAAAEERNRMRGVKGAEARVKKLEDQLRKANERLFREREKAIPGFFNPEVLPPY